MGRKSKYPVDIQKRIADEFKTNTCEELAKHYKISPATVWGYVAKYHKKNNMVPSIKTGGSKTTDTIVNNQDEYFERKLKEIQSI